MSVSDDVADWERHLCAPVTGRKIICAAEVLAGMTPLVALLQRWGAQRPLLIADGVGTGPLPMESDADAYVVETPRFGSVTEQVRARMGSEARLTDDVVALVERYDPDGEAAWWVGAVSLNSAMLGRPVLGGRPREQADLEDKTLVDTLLDEIAVPHQLSVNAVAAYDNLMAASQEVIEASDVEQVVWAGDSRDGINGGADYVRWIRTPDQARGAADFFAAHCDVVRVSPFLEGVPCSIHGIVLPDGVVTLRPVELATLRDWEHGRFRYAGLGTTWDPPAAEAADMRALARRLGTHLRRTRRYRGAFGVDGVLTADGFQVTELNPRFSGGLTRLSRAAPAAHLDLVQMNALLGRRIGRGAEQIEREVLPRLDDNRVIDVLGMSTRAEVDESVYVPVRAGRSGLEPAAIDDEDAVGTVSLGPSSMGSFVRLAVREGVVRRQGRAAPLGVLLLDFCDRTWGTGFGRLLAAPEVGTDRPG